MSVSTDRDVSTPPAGVAAPPASKMRVFGRRLASTLVLWGLLAAAIVFKVAWPFFLLVAVLALGALWEYLKMDREGHPVHRWFIMTVAAGYYAAQFIVCGSVPYLNAPSLDTLASIDVLAGTLAITGSFVPVLFRPLEGRRTLWQVFYPAFGFFYVAVLFSFVLRILFGSWNAEHPMAGMFYALFLVSATKFTDSGAYAIGSLIGRHKMIPHISPGKTWEGLGGAFLGATVGGMAVVCSTGSMLSLLGKWDAFFLCLLLGAICVVGDLAESIIKRCLEVKDSGRTLPGIGGALDLIDSLLYTTPVLYLYLRHVG
ncbi:MAG: CDP-archaeol synthase [Verrucomicrobiales bacterium]|nr:CDP-archaeol synthase [Verrucomicrobiales bacterium]